MITYNFTHMFFKQQYYFQKLLVRIFFIFPCARVSVFLRVYVQFNKMHVCVHNLKIFTFFSTVQTYSKFLNCILAHCVSKSDHKAPDVFEWKISNIIYWVKSYTLIFNHTPLPEEITCLLAILLLIFGSVLLSRRTSLSHLRPSNFEVTLNLIHHHVTHMSYCMISLSFPFSFSTPRP